MALASGTKLGPYEIQSPLGAGGMGEVYRARDTRLGRDVAIKVLPAHLSSDPDLRQRMEREARAISSLNHPYICTLHDMGSQDGIDFLVMEHLEGETLADRLRRGALPLDESLKIGILIAEALDKAHQRGIVHRDLKPANVMLTKNGPKLMDFGLAKPSPGVSSAAASPLTPSTPTISVAALAGSSSPLTQKGMIVGTFQYMAPEVLQGAEADARSDIFSFGCVLYEMVTGRRAFEGKSQFSVLGAILDQEPERVSALLPASPVRLDETVGRCLAKNPEQRYGCMHDVRIQLEGIAAGSEAHAAEGAQVAASGSGSRVAWAAAAIALLIAIGAGVAYFEKHETATVVRSTILPPVGTSFMTMLPAAGPPVLSPDGTQLAFTARDEKSKVMLYVRPLTSLTAQVLPGTEDAIYPFWSPDSRQIAFFAAGKLKKINASGGPPQGICDSFSGRGGSWSKDGVIVFTPSSNQGLFKVSANGGTPEPASKLNRDIGENSHRFPFFLPDGKHFIFWSRTSRAGESPVLYVGELGKLPAQLLMKSESMASYASGYLLFLRGQTLMAQLFDASKMELKGEPQPVAERIAINGASVRSMFAASDTGRLVYQTGEASAGWTLVWRDRQGKQTDAITKVERYISPALSPDGSRLAVTIFAGDRGIYDVWIFDLARGTNSRFTFGPASQALARLVGGWEDDFFGVQCQGLYSYLCEACRWQRRGTGGFGRWRFIRRAACHFRGRTLFGLCPACAQRKRLSHLGAAADGRAEAVSDCAGCVRRRFSRAFERRKMDGLPEQRIGPEGSLYHRVSGRRSEVAGFDQWWKLAEVAQRWEGIILSGSGEHSELGGCECGGRRAAAERSACVVSGGRNSAGFWPFRCDSRREEVFGEQRKFARGKRSVDVGAELAGGVEEVSCCWRTFSAIEAVGSTCSSLRSLYCASNQPRRSQKSVACGKIH